MTVSFIIEPFDPTAASQDDLAAYHSVDQALDLEALPDYPVMPLAQATLQQLHTPGYRTVERWLARAAGEVVGLAFATWTDTDDNRSHGYCGAQVLPAFRGNGLGSALLATAVDGLPDDRTLIDLDARVGGPAEPFLTELGAERKLVNRRSACPLVPEMRPLLQEWIDRAAERAAGYHVVTWDGPCPDELLERFVAARHVMNTAPLENLERDDDVWTEARWRDQEATSIARGRDPWTAAAIHDESGEVAGYSELHLPRLWPEVIYQEDTGVWPAHRARGLGRWLKATLALRALDERPEARFIETWNAGSNRPMLNINEAMGFACLEYWGEWQVPRELVTANLTRVTGG